MDLKKRSKPLSATKECSPVAITGGKLLQHSRIRAHATLNKAIELWDEASEASQRCVVCLGGAFSDWCLRFGPFLPTSLDLADAASCSLIIYIVSFVLADCFRAPAELQEQVIGRCGEARRSSERSEVSGRMNLWSPE